MIINENWKRIDNYPRYSISDAGRVRREEFYSKNGMLMKAMNMKTTLTKDGYAGLGLTNDNGTKSFMVHRLVAQAFIPNPENKPQVNHLDEDKTNNNVENLAWVTSKENNDWGTRKERAIKSSINNPKRDYLELGKKFSKSIYSIDKDGNRVDYCGVHEASRQTGFAPQTISSNLNGKIKSTGKNKLKFYLDN